MTFEPLDCVRVTVYLVSVCSAPLPVVRRLQAVGPCETHLTGEQRRLSAYTAHESGEGREDEGFACPGKQAGREMGGRQRRTKQIEMAEQLTRHRKKDRLKDIFRKKAEMHTDTSSPLY